MMVRRQREGGEVPFRKKNRSDDEVVAGLREVSFFEDFTDKELARVAELADAVEAETGTHLTDQGKPGLECYVVADGTAGVFIGDDRIATLGPGELVGEMALIDHRPRSATVVAETPMHLLAFDAKRFRTLLDEMPKARDRMLVELNRRLRERNFS
jgi:CRP/FNR family transcriptional regulator, cyclic AMP receptor protein